VSNPVPRLRRLLSIIPLIQRRGGISLGELQSTLGVSKRELQGDLNAIMLCGVPPYLPNDYISLFIDGDHVTVDYAEHFSRPARLNLQEALALRLAIARLQIPEEGELYEASIDLLEALDSLMLGQDMAALEGRIEAPKFEAMDDRLNALDEAVAKRKPVDLVYYSASRDAIDARRVRPYGRGDKRGNHYLVAHCEKADAQRSFRLDRISSIALANDAPPFEVPANFNLDKTLSDIGPKLGDGAFPVRLRFDKAIARYAVEDNAQLKVERSPDGDAVGELTVGSPQWGVSYALRYGELAEVLEPETVREELTHRLRAYLDSSSNS
jgi:proteasome accessory factor C